MNRTTAGIVTCAAIAALLIIGCTEDATAPQAASLSGGGAVAAAPQGPPFNPKPLKRHIESFAGSVPGLSNFSLTLTCPNKMIAVGGGHDVGADINAAQFLVSKPVTDPDRWTFVVFNPHATPRPFEVHVVCLR